MLLMMIYGQYKYLHVDPGRNVVHDAQETETEHSGEQQNDGIGEEEKRSPEEEEVNDEADPGDYTGRRTSEYEKLEGWEIPRLEVPNPGTVSGK